MTRIIVQTFKWALPGLMIVGIGLLIWNVPLVVGGGIVTVLMAVLGFIAYQFERFLRWTDTRLGVRLGGIGPGRRFHGVEPRPVVESTKRVWILAYVILYAVSGTLVFVCLVLCMCNSYLFVFGLILGVLGGLGLSGAHDFVLPRVLAKPTREAEPRRHFNDTNAGSMLLRTVVYGSGAALVAGSVALHFSRVATSWVSVTLCFLGLIVVAWSRIICRKGAGLSVCSENSSTTP